MPATTSPTLSRRDRAVLSAIRAGRCLVSAGAGIRLTVDGKSCCDQFIGHRLVRAGLVALPGSAPGLARLTPSGLALLHMA